MTNGVIIDVLTNVYTSEREGVERPRVLFVRAMDRPWVAVKEDPIAFLGAPCVLEAR